MRLLSFTECWSSILQIPGVYNKVGRASVPAGFRSSRWQNMIGTEADLTDLRRSWHLKPETLLGLTPDTWNLLIPETFLCLKPRMKLNTAGTANRRILQRRVNLWTLNPEPLSTWNRQHIPSLDCGRYPSDHWPERLDKNAHKSWQSSLYCCTMSTIVKTRPISILKTTILYN